MLEKHIQVRLIYQDGHSQTVDYSWKKHWVLLSNPPEQVEIGIRDFYPGSPNISEKAVVSFQLFELMARKFSLEEAAQLQKDYRHLEFDPISDNQPSGEDLESICCDRDEKHYLTYTFSTLSRTQWRRLYNYYYKHLTYRQIAKNEGVSERSVRESLQAARQKLKNIL